MKHSAIYAGTFDPITLGHLDLMERASHIFERVIVAVVEHSRKTTKFSVDERLEMVRESVSGFENVTVESFDGLLVNFARSRNIHVLVRGLRAYSDFEYEFQMALINRKLAPEIETIFLMPKETHSYLSSSIVGEVAELRGDIGNFVPECVKSHIAGYIDRRTDAE